MRMRLTVVYDTGEDRNFMGTRMIVPKQKPRMLHEMCPEWFGDGWEVTRIIRPRKNDCFIGLVHQRSQRMVLVQAQFIRWNQR